MSRPEEAPYLFAGGAGKHRARPRAGPARRIALAVTAAVALAGAVLLHPAGAGSPNPPPSPPASADGLRITAAGAIEPGGSSSREQHSPVRVRIPSIGVDSSLALLSLDHTGALAPPADFSRAGWFAGGPVPGDVGPAVIAGHVDSRDGPAVFFRLRDLAPGDEVLVDRADGSTVRFEVTATARHPKDDFPTQDVYGPTPRAELRLITCGGDFDRDRRSYRDNVVVSAVRA